MAEANGNMEFDCTQKETEMIPSTDVDQVPLEKTYIYVHRCGSVGKNKRGRCNIILGNYPEFPCDRDFCAKIPKQNLYLTVRKETGKLMVTLDNETKYKPVQFHLRIYEEYGRHSICLRVDKSRTACFDMTDYVSEIKIEVSIEWNEKELDKTYSMVGRRIFKSHVVSAPGNTILPRKNEDDLMTGSLMGIRSRKRFVNFDIHVTERVIHVHKALLAARSKFFCDYIRENCEHGKNGAIRIETTYKAVSTVVNFLYCGEIEVKKVHELLEILALATKFELMELELMCTDYLWEYMEMFDQDSAKIKEIKSALERIPNKADGIKISNPNKTS